MTVAPICMELHEALSHPSCHLSLAYSMSSYFIDKEIKIQGLSDVPKVMHLLQKGNSELGLPLQASWRPGLQVSCLVAPHLLCFPGSAKPTLLCAPSTATSVFLLPISVTTLFLSPGPLPRPLIIQAPRSYCLRQAWPLGWAWVVCTLRLRLQADSEGWGLGCGMGL